MTTSLTTARADALAALLDDESPSVRSGVLEELQRLDREGIAFLRAIASGSNRVLAAYARNYLEDLREPDGEETFLRFIRSLGYELESGFILLDRVCYPDADNTENCLRLDAIAARCRELTIHPTSLWDRCRVLNRVLFHEYGFRSGAEDFDDPQSCFFTPLLDRQRGVPIALAILYILVGQRCGLDLGLVAMPGRFLVGCFYGDEPLFIDPAERGTFLTHDDIRDWLESRDMRPRPGYFAPLGAGDTLSRCCRQIARQFKAARDYPRAGQFERFVREFKLAQERPARP